MESQITVEVLVNAPIEKVWEYWTKPEHIVNWNFASSDWCSPNAVNDLKVGGEFNFRMEAKDGSGGFDFQGTYSLVEPNKKIEYTIIDGRKVTIEFGEEGGGCRVVETFEAEKINPLEMQKSGWQAILNNFKKYVEKG
jgi:uncharacterized protein YndB with AHSA1/START domain